MERLCDEVLQLIFFELSDPTPLTLLSKRFYQFSQDPYVRAHYFITRYGQTQALYWAFGRGAVLNANVIDLLIACGAHMSRYLVQVAMHHFFRTSSHFVKTSWVRTVSYPTFVHFMKIAADMYGNILCGKGEDDGTIFTIFLKESRYPVGMKSVTWEWISEIVEKYKFIPFSNKDPIMAQFPLALSIEPRLLPLAEVNGFRMDNKFRDLVFRKMFERPAVFYDTRVDEIIHNVKELSRLDTKMFLSRTVASEICMEAKVNEHAYEALKKLDKMGELRFELSSMVEELIKSFSKTRSITSPNNINVLRQLYGDFPSTDSTVRLVLLLTVFLSGNPTPISPTNLKSKIDSLGLSPLVRKDIYGLLINPFIERHSSIIEYAEKEMELDEDEMDDLIEEVAIKCLEVGCKGKMLRKLAERDSSLQDTLADVVSSRFKINLDDLPPYEDEKACATFKAPLCRDTSPGRFLDSWTAGGSAGGSGQMPLPSYGSDSDDDDVEIVLRQVGQEPEVQDSDGHELGSIDHQTLTTMIRRDELARCRPRRRFFDSSIFGEVQDSMSVGRWVKQQYGVKSEVTAVFMKHAIVNDNLQIVRHYLTGCSESTDGHVPITLMHFKLLSRLGKAPDWSLFNEIEQGAEFYFTEEDYLSPRRSGSKKALRARVMSEPTLSNVASALSPPSPSPNNNRKRPRRSAAEAVRSYVVPDSDDEMEMDEQKAGCSSRPSASVSQSKKKAESNLQLWIEHLSVLFKEEQEKFKEKKRVEKELSNVKTRTSKSDFFKSLTANLRNLRELESVKRRERYGSEAPERDSSDGDDDEYQEENSRGKRRKGTKTTGTTS